MTPLTIFISYTHDSPAHSGEVLALSDNLRKAGFDCDIDQYHANQDWPAWMERKIRESDFVLVVCTPTYLRRWQNEEAPGVGLGAQWESLLARQHLYTSPGLNDRFVPVFFDKVHVSSIPTPLQSVTRVHVAGPEGFDRLCRRLLNIPPAEKPPLRTSLAPFCVAEGFFSGTAAAPTARPRNDEQSGFDHLPIGVTLDPERLAPNLFKVVFPPAIQAAKLKLRRGVKLTDRLEAAHKHLRLPGRPQVDFWVEEGVVYRFEAFSSPVWHELLSSHLLQKLPPKRSDDWALSRRMADKNLFIKLLNRSLDGLCAESEMEFELGWSNQMRCHLFLAKAGTRAGSLKLKAITHMASREVYKAIPDKLSGIPSKIQHWQHQAFRHNFVRFGGVWYLNLVPFWAFTGDGRGGPSRWQKASSANMRRREKNRAFLGHVLFWASILCREPDLLRSSERFRLERPVWLDVTPSIQDTAWMDIASDDEREALASEPEAEGFL